MSIKNKELNEVSILRDQKNQLEIEKDQIIKSLESLEEENLKPNKIIQLKNLTNQKNQLEIEKKELESRYNLLLQENESLKQKFDDFKRKDIE